MCSLPQRWMRPNIRVQRTRALAIARGARFARSLAADAKALGGSGGTMELHTSQLDPVSVIRISGEFSQAMTRSLWSCRPRSTR